MSMQPGTRVIMSSAMKRELAAAGRDDHLADFGGSIGIVAGSAHRNAGGEAGPEQSDREVDVCWQPGGPRYAYPADKLIAVQLVIAVDGPAASGKGTLARRVATFLGFPCLDTGLLYRAVARDVLRSGRRLEDAAAIAAAAALDPASLDDPELRGSGVGEAASKVAGISAVRSALIEYQRNFATNKPGAVLDGRDIGTVVCPDADVKIFISADVGVRAERRYLERIGRGENVTREDIYNQILRRDERDRSRVDSPMRPADDAFLLDTTDLDIETAFDAALELIMRKIGQPAA